MERSMTILPALAAMSLMGLQLPAFGSGEKQLRDSGFQDALSDAPASSESQTFSKTMTSKVLGRVRVSAVTVKDSVRTVSVACWPTRACAVKPPIPADRCKNIGRNSWQCSQKEVEFEVHSCGGFVYFLILPGEAFSEAVCTAFRPPTAGRVPGDGEMKMAHSSGWETTNPSPCKATTGGTRRGQGYQEAETGA